MSNNDNWWYYLMGQDAAKHPNKGMSNGMVAWFVLLAIIGLILFGVLVGVVIWCFA